MKIAILSTITVLTLSACASMPSDIKASSVNPNIHKDKSCVQITSELEAERENLTNLSALQEGVRKNDSVGVALIGLPVGSMFKKDKAEDIAKSKGNIEALKTASTKCK